MGIHAKRFIPGGYLLHALAVAAYRFVAFLVLHEAVAEIDLRLELEEDIREI